MTRFAAVGLVVLASSCATPSLAAPPPAPPPTSATKPAKPVDDGFYLVGAGDIASCEVDDDEATAKLVEASIAGRKNAMVFTAGDNAYQKGTAEEYAKCYGPNWGRFKDRTRPVVGNHEYLDSGAMGHFTYFGAAAGMPGQGWYSYDHGGWHVVVLNSNCKHIDCKAEAAWLVDDLKKSPAKCTVAMWHHPLFSSGEHGRDNSVEPFWKILDAANADVVLNGHDHIYERFAPMHADGTADPAKGMREFVVGAGGKSHYPFPGPRMKGSEVSNDDTYGIFEMKLEEGRYRWKFIPVPGGTFTDEGSATCH